MRTFILQLHCRAGWGVGGLLVARESVFNAAAGVSVCGDSLASLLLARPGGAACMRCVLASSAWRLSQSYSRQHDMHVKINRALHLRILPAGALFFAPCSRAPKDAAALLLDSCVVGCSVELFCLLCVPTYSPAQPAGLTTCNQSLLLYPRGAAGSGVPAPAAVHQPPCSVEMNTTWSPSCSSVPSVPLQQ